MAVVLNKRPTILVVNGVTLKPGRTTVPDKLITHRVFKHWTKAGWVEVNPTDPVEPEEPEEPEETKAPKKAATTPQAPTETDTGAEAGNGGEGATEVFPLHTVPAGEAKELIETETDLEVLRAWQAAEKRKLVSALIEKRIAVLGG